MSHSDYLIHFLMSLLFLPGNKRDRIETLTVEILQGLQL